MPIRKKFYINLCNLLICDNEREREREKKEEEWILIFFTLAYTYIYIYIYVRWRHFTSLVNNWIILYWTRYLSGFIKDIMKWRWNPLWIMLIAGMIKRFVLGILTLTFYTTLASLLHRCETERLKNVWTSHGINDTFKQRSPSSLSTIR